MKKLYLIAGLFAFAACTEDYTDWADPQTNEQEDDIAAVTATFSAGANSTIVMDDFERTDSAKVLAFTSCSVDGAEFTPTSFTLNGEDFSYSYEDDNFKVALAELDSVSRDIYGSRASVARELTVKTVGYVVVDEQGLAVESDEVTISFTPISTPDIDSNGYYILGDFVENDYWSLASPVWMDDNGDGTYTATVTTTGSGDNWYKFYCGSYYSYGTDDDWSIVNQGVMGCKENGDSSDTGFIVWTGDKMAADEPQTIVITGEGKWDITLDMVNMTYSVKSVAAETWYLVGGCIGDGSWKNEGVSDVGVSLYPMAYVSEGVISYTGYLTTDGFKLIKTPSSWDDQWGETEGTYVKNDGGSGNITISADGYYTVTLDYFNDVLTVEAAESDYTTYDQILITGDFDGWGCTNAMTLCTGSDHLWMYNLSSDSDTTAKFLTDTTWTTNWGGDTFPSGTGVSNGSNIPVTAGSYVVIFNDIDGGYTFVAE